MSYQGKLEFRSALTNDSTLTSTVPSGSITVAFNKDDWSSPCISIYQVGGQEKALVGYNSAPSGSKEKQETCIMQLDIYSRTSVTETEQIADLISDVLTPDYGTLQGLVKTSDLDSFYDSSLEAYHKIVTWSFFRYSND